MQQRRMLRSVVAAGAILIAQFSGCTLSTNGTADSPGGTAGSSGTGLSGQGGTTSSNQGGYGGVAGSDASLGGEGGTSDAKDASPKDAKGEVLANSGGSSGQGGIHNGGSGGAATGGAAGASAQGGAAGIAPAGAAGTADPPDGASEDVTIVADVVLPDADDGAAGAAGTVNVDSGTLCALSLPGADDCNTCMNVRCRPECDACAADQDCKAYANCLIGCTNDTCKKGCQDKYKSGEGKLKALAGDKSCLDSKCKNECPDSVTTTPSGCSISSAPQSRNGSVGVLVLLTFGLLVRKRRNQQIL